MDDWSQVNVLEHGANTYGEANTMESVAALRQRIDAAFAARTNTK